MVKYIGISNEKAGESNLVRKSASFIGMEMKGK